jgi:hypothetical protein
MKKYFGILALFSSLALTAKADTTLVFNEVMYHPAGNEPTNEWVELYNQMAVDLDISNWRLGGDVDFTFPNNTRVPGRGFIVVAINPGALMAATGLNGVYGPFLHRLNNGSGTLRIYNNVNRLMDELQYGVDGDWPVPPDGSGVSLAKRDRDLGTGQAANWTWSAQVSGTPGTENFALASNIRLFSVDASWRYEASGTDLGTTWRQPNYNESLWASRYFLTNRSVANLFNTGVGDNKVALVNNSSDPHYVLTLAAEGTVGAQATVIANNAAWLGNDQNSTWVGIRDGAQNTAFGNFGYRTGFSLDGFILPTVQINLVVAADDVLTSMSLNGVDKGFTHTGFAAYSAPFALTGFTGGSNTLDFAVQNGGVAANPHGFRAVFTSSGLSLNTNGAPAINNSTYYFRKSFTFNDDPRYASLTINPVLADGAVVYLNGVEVYRQNMPAGPINYSTAALSNAVVNYAGVIPISASNLVAGANVLAVEVHQAEGSPDGPVIGMEMTYSQSPAPSVTLAFNEFNGTTNSELWVELLNYGTNSFDLGGMRVQYDGTNNGTYVIPSGTVLNAGQFLVLTNSTLGFTQWQSGDKLILSASNSVVIYDGVVLKKNARARYPDGTGNWLTPSALTPGANNSFSFRSEIVINEIMYHHKGLPAGPNGFPPKENAEAWIELYNRSSNVVDLTDWKISGGVDYNFRPGRTILPGAYLVIADDYDSFHATYPAVDAVGNLGGRLSGSNDRILLEDPTGNPADEVHYYSDGRWPGYADGGGSSLELRDPNADNSKAEAWAASDESSKSGWLNYSYRMTAAASATASPDTQWREFVFGLLAGGECLIDDMSLIQNPTTTPLQFLDNGNFEAGITGWRVLGNHGRSFVEPEPGNPGNKVLHLVASGAQEHMHNHIEATFPGGRSIANGTQYEISFRAKWLAGNHLLNTRAYFNRLARTTALSYPENNGTPGARNSRYVTNAGPTFANFAHSPMTPQVNQAVTVSVQAQDPQSVTNCTVFYSVNGGAWAASPMTLQSGSYSGTIPGQGANALVQFYVQATDGAGAVSTFPAAGPNSGALYRVFDNAAILAPLHNMRILMSPANTALMHASTNVMSNETLPATVIYDERVAYYDIGVRLKSSERGRDNSARVGFHIEFHPDHLFRGVHPVMLIDRSNGGSRPANEEIILRHMLLHTGVPAVNPDLCRVLSPRTSEYGTAILAPRFEDEFVDTQYEDGGEGTLFELELIYYPTSANAQGYKLPQPDAVQGLDYSDLGNDKEPYRYNFIIKNHREADDYTRFIPFAKAFSLNGAQLDQQSRLLMDISQWMRAYGMVSLCGVGDMYTFGNNHNFMTYLRAGDQKMLYFPWDMDFSFNNGATTALVGNQNLAKIVNLTPNFRCMLTHIQEMVATTYNTNYMAYWIGHYGAMAGQNYSADNGYIQQRGAFALTQIPNASYAVNGTNFVNTGSNVIVLTGTAPVQVKTITINGVEYPVTWTSTTAWSITVPLNTSSNSLDVTFEDLHGLVLSNINRTVTVTNAVADPRGAVVFNEIMYNPLVPDSGYVELFNNSFTTAFDLSGWRINGLDFTFPGTVIGPRQFVVVAASTVAYAGTYGLAGGTPAGEFRGNLQNDGEMLTLIKPAASSNDVDVVIDRVRYESSAPWSTNADGTGSSLQLIDPNQENARVGNWFSSFTPANFSPEVIIPAGTNDGWRFVKATGTTPGGNITNLMRLCTYITEIGSAIIDDVMLVPGTNAGVGTNFVINGDFETPLTNGTYTFTNGTVVPTGWTFGTNYSNSVVISDLAHAGSGSLKEIGSFPGSILQPNFLRSINQVLAPPPLTNAVHTLSFWFWATNSATNLHVRVINSGGLSAAPGNNPTNINITYTPSNYIAPTLISPATNTLSPGIANQRLTNLPAFAPLWLNEVQAENISGVTDTSGEHEPWVEIYNASTNTVSLEGLYLSHNYTNQTNWAFPAGSSIGPTQFLIVFCDGEAGETTGSEYHTSFRLPVASGSIALARLYNDAPQVLDYINYAGLHSDRSYGSFPDGQPFERYEFIYVTPRGTNDGRSAPLTVFVNEWLASNVGLLIDPADGDFDDWFEIYNPTTNTVNLAGFYLTDTATNKTKFLITTNMTHTIPPLGHLLVWADNETGQNLSNGVPRPDLHANFQLAKGGEALGIYAADGTAIDLVTFGPQVDDVTQGRYPDGTAYITSMPGTASPRAANYLTGSGNTPPSLNPIGNKVLYFGQTLMFTATASDSDLPAQSLNYSLDAGAPAGAAIGNGSGIFSWTPAAAGTSTFNVRVTDSGAPPLSDFETIMVEVLPAPSFTQSLRNGASLELSWGTRAGKKYAVDSTMDLNPPIAWAPVLTNLATGNTLNYTNATTNGVQLFFRIRNIE